MRLLSIKRAVFVDRRSPIWSGMTGDTVWDDGRESRDEGKRFFDKLGMTRMVGVTGRYTIIHHCLLLHNAPGGHFCLHPGAPIGLSSIHKAVCCTRGCHQNTPGCTRSSKTAPSEAQPGKTARNAASVHEKGGFCGQGWQNAASVHEKGGFCGQKIPDLVGDDGRYGLG